jgi:hypothetical protein
MATKVRTIFVALFVIGLLLLAGVMVAGVILILRNL